MFLFLVGIKWNKNMEVLQSVHVRVLAPGSSFIALKVKLLVKYILVVSEQKCLQKSTELLGSHG